MNILCFGFKKVLLVLLCGLAMQLSAARPLATHAFHGPDYRVGLHTHQGYPADMAAALDIELAKWRNTRANWAEADLPRLIEHANQFNAPLIVHGGISWSIIQESLAVTVVAESPLLVRFDGANPVSGEFLFAGDSLFEVGAGDQEQGTWTLNRLQGDLALANGQVLSRYRAQLNRNAAQSLRELTCTRLIVQLVLLPRGDDPLPAALFGSDGGRHRLALEPQHKNTTTDFFNQARFQMPLLAEPGHGKVADVRARFIQSLYEQLVDQISEAARDAQGRGKIAYWLLGNEPDVLIPVTPARYLDWLIAFNHILQARQAPGEMLLANVSGLGFEFDTWLAQLEKAVATALAEGRLDPAHRPFQAAAITHYLSPAQVETEHLVHTTERFVQRIRALDALFDNPQPSRLIAKEIAFQGQNGITERLLVETAAGDLETTAKATLRYYVSALKKMGYDDVVWFNQMPTGFGHGKVIDDVRSVQETALGRYLRRLNQSHADETQAPIQVTLFPSEAGLAYRLSFQPTFHEFNSLNFSLSVENGLGRKLASRQGRLDRDNHLVQGLWTDLDLGADYQVDLTYSEPGDWGADYHHVFRKPRSVKGTPLLSGERDRRKNDAVNIPDDALRQYLLDQYDLNQDGVLSVAEAAQPTFADWDLPYVRDLSGLEAFTALDYLRIKIAPQITGDRAEIVMPTLTASDLHTLRLTGFTLAETWTVPASVGSLTFSTSGNFGRLDLTNCDRLAVVLVDDQLNTTPVPLFGNPTLIHLSLAGVVIDQPSALHGVQVDVDTDFLRCTFPNTADLGFFRVAGKLKFLECTINRIRGRFREVDELRFVHNGLSAEQLQGILFENDLDQLPYLSVIQEPLGVWPQFNSVPGLTRLELIDCGLETPSGQAVKPSYPPQLRHLSLTGNRLTYLPLYQTLPLETLNLAGNELRSTWRLRFCPTLETLDISNNPSLSKVEELGFLTRLRRLEFRRCGFRQFPDVFLVPTLTALFGKGNSFSDQCGQAAYYLNDTTRWYIVDAVARLPGTTDLLCGASDQEPAPVFDDQPLRALAATAQGDQILLSWQGGARRNFQFERYLLETGAAWRQTEGDPYQTQLSLALIDERGEFFLSSVGGQMDPLQNADTIDQVALSLDKTTTSWRYPLPHVPVDQGWLVDLDFTNQSSLPATVTVLAVSRAGATSTLQTLTLAGRQQQRHGLDELLGSVAREAVSWVLFVSDQPLAVQQTLSRAEAQHLMSQQPLAPAYAREGFFHLPKKDRRFFRALVFTNTHLDLAVQIKVWRYFEDGRNDSPEVLNLAPGEKWVGLAADLVGLDRDDSMLRWEADLPVVDMMIYGRVAPFTMLSTDVQTNRAGFRGSIGLVDPLDDVIVTNTSEFPMVVRFYHDDQPGRQQRISLPRFGTRRMPRDILFPEQVDLPVYYESDGPVRVSWLSFRRWPSYSKSIRRERSLP